MKIGDLFAAVYYYYANKAESYPESVAAGDAVEALSYIERLIDNIIEREWCEEMAEQWEMLGVYEDHLRDTVLSRDFKAEELAEELEAVYTRGDCPALDCWIEDILGPTPEEVARLEAWRKEYNEAPRKYAIIGRGVHEVIYLSGEWHRVHPKHGKTRVGVIKENNLFEDQKEAQRELRKRQG